MSLKYLYFNMQTTIWGAHVAPSCDPSLAFRQTVKHGDNLLYIYNGLLSLFDAAETSYLEKKQNVLHSLCIIDE